MIGPPALAVDDDRARPRPWCCLRGPGRGVDGRAAGFTLMETLVMLVLVSFAVLLMFQMLGAYRIAGERAAAQAGNIDRQGLFDAWFMASVRGLHATEDAPMQGSKTDFSAVTLNPLYGSPGAPTPVRWELVSAAGKDTLVRYWEAGEQRWQLPLRDGDKSRFAYVDKQGKERRYQPDFLCRIKTPDDQRFNLIVEITGFSKDKELKRYYMQQRWLPAVNSQRDTMGFLPWHFVEITDIERIKNALIEAIERISAEVDAAAERSFWMNAQASSLATIWGDDDDQLFAMQN